ncbi:MAG: hypothetical protein C0511_02075 [Hyphomicrobium sp.]|nr:hypothetical protein [Hyphomicrobium sp.]PPC83543.1 MAG: hypothetical protein CTY40_02070 [Hyphomicrobium sp.]
MDTETRGSRFRCQLAVALAAAVAVANPAAIAAQSLSPQRQEFKQMMAASMKAPASRQRVTLGPMKDGRTIIGRFQYIENHKGVGVLKQRDGSFCVNFDRRTAALAGLAVDASIHCQQLGRCDRLSDYVKSLIEARTSVADLALFEEFEPSVGPALSRWARTPDYARAWIAGFGSFVVATQLHEIGHVALGHESAAEGAAGEAQEAEADGFSKYVTELAGVSGAAGSAILLDSLVAARQVVTTTGRRDQRVQPSDERGLPTPSGFRVCRVEAVVLGLQAWFDRYHPGYGNRSRLPARATAAPLGSDFDFTRGLTAIVGGTPSCEAYATAFRFGVDKAMALVDVQTKLNSENDVGKTCKDE